VTVPEMSELSPLRPDQGDRPRPQPSQADLVWRAEVLARAEEMVSRYKETNERQKEALGRMGEELNKARQENAALKKGQGK
jgi:hypothetical protein